MKLHDWPTPDAEEQILEIGEWWRANRLVARNLFKEQIKQAYATLAEMPLIGAPYPCPVAGVRRLRLRKTPYHVYYVPRVDQGEVIIVAVWSSMRKYGPPIRVLTDKTRFPVSPCRLETRASNSPDPRL